jgi:PPP family 3-phenylpropionic acid transporter
VLYWCSAAALFCFAVSFLRDRGFSNGEAGLVTALGNLLGLSLAIVLGAELDRGRFRLLPATLLTLGLLMLSAGLLSLHSGRDLFTGACLVLAFAANLALNPLYIKLSTLLQRLDALFRFGLPRGAGSLAFAGMAWVMGLLVQGLTVSAVPPAILITAALQLPVLLSLRGVFALPGTEAAEPKRGAPLGDFLRASPRFALLLGGIALIFAANNTVNNFLINVVQNLKGDYADLGRLTFFSGVIEFPAMLIYSRLDEKRRARCLGLSLLFFPVKLLAISLAGSVALLFLAYVFHALSFGLYTPAVVDHVERSVRPEDSAKGQSLTAAVASVGTTVATLAGGLLLDRLPVQTVLLILTAAAALGAALGLRALRR